MQIATYVFLGLVVLFSARRLLWVLAACRGDREAEKSSYQPDIDILVSVHNEETDLPGLLSSLDALDYPRERMYLCIVDDASTDATWKIARFWADSRTSVNVVRLSERAGKAEALNHGLHHIGNNSIVVIYDADQRPRPESLNLLIQPFRDPQTGAVGGYRNPLAQSMTPISGYACMEAWVHQLVNLSAKETLGLNPPTMGGNCAYRRSYLEQAGGFPSGLYSEDIYVSLAIVAAGGRTHFVRQAIADHYASTSLRHFFNQRLRWTQGLLSARSQVSELEGALVVTGYLDRIAILGLTACAALGHAKIWMLSLYVLPAVSAMACALLRVRPSGKLAILAITTLPVMFLVDVGVSLVGSLRGLIPKPIRWLNRVSGTESRDKVSSR